MNKKNKGFSVFVAMVGSLILMGIAVAIIVSINRSLDQVNNIARSNQFFFASESGKEAALFHHNVRGAGLKVESNYDVVPENDRSISHDSIGASVEWSIDGRLGDRVLTGEISENQKVTIPLYWDSVSDIFDDETIVEISDPTERQDLNLTFSTVNDDFDFGLSAENAVLIVWSVSRVHPTNGLQVFIPNADNPHYPCGYASDNSSFYCKGDLPNNTASFHRNFTSGIIDFGSATEGLILPGNIVDNLANFMGSCGAPDCSSYEISFQPVLPFTNSVGNKISSIDFTLDLGAGVVSPEIPKNEYTITSSVDFGSFEKTQEYTYEEKPAIGAFDYLIFK